MTIQIEIDSVRKLQFDWGELIVTGNMLLLDTAMRILVKFSCEHKTV